MMHGLRALDRALARLEDWGVTVIVAVMAVLLGLGVVLRYVFNDPLTWSEEFVVTVFVWAVMLGVPSALHRRSLGACSAAVPRSLGARPCALEQRHRRFCW